MEEVVQWGCGISVCGIFKDPTGLSSKHPGLNSVLALLGVEVSFARSLLNCMILWKMAGIGLGEGVQVWVLVFFLIWFAMLLVQGSCSLLYSRKERDAEAGSCLQQVYKTGKNIFVTTYGGKELFLLRWSKWDHYTNQAEYVWGSSSCELAQWITCAWMDRCEENFQLISGLWHDGNRGGSCAGMSIFGWTFKERRWSLCYMRRLMDEEYLWWFESRW